MLSLIQRAVLDIVVASAAAFERPHPSFCKFELAVYDNTFIYSSCSSIVLRINLELKHVHVQSGRPAPS